jgi:hypothetical protein
MLLLKPWCACCNAAFLEYSFVNDIPPFPLYFFSFCIHERLQVDCHVHDPTARFKSWDAAFIAVGSSHIGFSSSSDKAVARALGRDAAAVQDHKAIPLPGCTVRAVTEHDGRKHVMAVAAPTLSRQQEKIFAFHDGATRDAFMRAVRVRLPRRLVNVIA